MNIPAFKQQVSQDWTGAETARRVAEVLPANARTDGPGHQRLA